MALRKPDAGSAEGAADGHMGVDAVDAAKSARISTTVQKPRFSEDSPT